MNLWLPFIFSTTLAIGTPGICGSLEKTPAQKTEVKIIHEWRGQIGLSPSPSTFTVVCEPEKLKELWKSWNVKAPPPSIDFKEELVVCGFSRSGRIEFHHPTIDIHGNLETRFVVTPDHPSCYSYIIGVIKRDRILTVDGKSTGCIDVENVGRH